MRCGGETELPLPLCLPAAARVGSDGTNAVVLGSLVGKGRCKYDGEEVGCGEEEAPQDEWCAKGAHLGSTLVRSGVLLLSAVARATKASRRARRCGSVWRSSYQAQRLEACEQSALVEQEAADDGFDMHVHVLGRVDAQLLDRRTDPLEGHVRLFERSRLIVGEVL